MQLRRLLLTFCFSSLFSLAYMPVSGQRVAKHPTAIAHSHNDYLQPQPLVLALKHRFGSLEADIFLINDSLFVAHTRAEIEAEKTLKRMYLEPLSSFFDQQKEKLYRSPNAPLQFLIDLKTPYEGTLRKLVEELEPYRHLLFPDGPVKVVISGNTPPPDLFGQYPPYIFFDGRPEISYNVEQIKKLGLISQSFTKYSRWKGQGPIPKEDADSLRKVIQNAHRVGKPFRFWANPDNKDGWEALLKMRVDYLNTDRIEELTSYLLERKTSK